jgi:lysophospholipase L1-like esterase
VQVRRGGRSEERSRSHSRVRRGALTLLAILVVALGVAAVEAGGRGVTTTTVAGSASGPLLYLDLGASVSRGVQPTVRHPSGEPTNRGYANRLVAALGARGLHLRPTQLGCPGESLASMVHGPDRCYSPPATQLAAALRFLREHRGAPTLVSVDIGFNTLDVCFHHLDIDVTCVTPVLATLRVELTSLMSRLAAAAGPRVTFVGLNHYNPYLVKAAREGAAETFALNSVVAIGQMNAVFDQVYRSLHVAVADVADAFHEPDSRAIFSGKERIATNVRFACLYTWMCAPRPYGPNIHPRDAGYAAIARAILQVLPAAW